MKYEQVIAHYASDAENDKGVNAAARALGFTKTALVYWRKHGIPLRTQELISAKTGLPVDQPKRKKA